MSNSGSRAVTLSIGNPHPRVLQWMLALLVAVIAVSTADAQNTSRTRSARTSRNEERAVRFDTTVAVEKGTILDVTAATGSIIVRGWDRNEIEVRAESESGEFQFSRSARSVRFEARRITRARDEVSIQIRVPLNTRTVIANSSGEVQVLDVRGEVDANLLNGEVIIRGASGRTAISTVNAEVTVTDVDGPLKVQSMTGEIALREIRGDIEVISSSGEVSMSGIQANHVQTEMVQGDIFFDGALNPYGKYDFSTHSGDVHLFFPQNAAGSLNLQSFTGSLHSSVPMLMQSDSTSPRAVPAHVRQFTNRAIALNQPRKLQFGGGGSTVISVTTFNGDVHISRGPRREQKEK